MTYHLQDSASIYPGSLLLFPNGELGASLTHADNIRTYSYTALFGM